VIRGRGLPYINTVVDAYNLVSLKHLIPMGGFNLDRVVGNIKLRFSAGGERFLSIGSSTSEETYKGEVVYADEARILTRRWNHRDCEETKITERTTNIMLFADGSDDITVEAVNSAMEDLASVLSKICGGKISFRIVDGKCRIFNI
jgi:lysyl-tRNA synthetase class 2